MLEHVLGENLLVVFCGTAAGYRSNREGNYYAGRGNKFWATLFRTGLTPRQFRPEEYALLLAHDIGLTDLVQKRAGIDADLGPEDYDVSGFRGRIAEAKPKIVAFNGKKAAQVSLNLASVAYGRRSGTLEVADVYVLPSTAKTAHDFWNDRPWHELAAAVKALRRR